MNDYLALLIEFERRGIVTRTFRRLDAERQQAVVSAVLEEATVSGPADLNIKKVAERAKVSVGSLYQYFGSRAGLLDFAIELVVSTTIELFNSYRAMLVEMPLREALPAYLSGGVEWSQEQMAVVRFFASAAYQGDPRLAERVVRPVAETMRSIVEDMLQAAVARGEVRSDLDVPAVTRVLNMLLLIAGDVQILPYLNVYFQFSDSTLPVERGITALLDLVERGLTSEGVR
jgi:AcrR family transcriptional regulator